MFRLRRIGIDTQSEHVVFIDERTVREGALGFEPLDRVRVVGEGGEVTGILNFCRDSLLAKDEIGLSESAFLDLGMPEGDRVNATHARSPESVERVRAKLRGGRLTRGDFGAILEDVVARRYSKPELSMFVLACALRNLDRDELVDLTGAMVDCGSRLKFDAPVVADKHCIGGVPGNRTTLVIVPILASLGVRSRRRPPARSRARRERPTRWARWRTWSSERGGSIEVVERVGGCIAWGGALDLAPADDVLITVERPMQIDTEAQMVASILSKKKTAGATHALIDIPLGPSAEDPLPTGGRGSRRPVPVRRAHARPVRRHRGDRRTRPDRPGRRAPTRGARRALGPPPRGRCAAGPAGEVALPGEPHPGADRVRPGRQRLPRRGRRARLRARRGDLRGDRRCTRQAALARSRSLPPRGDGRTGRTDRGDRLPRDQPDRKARGIPGQRVGRPATAADRGRDRRAR